MVQLQFSAHLSVSFVPDLFALKVMVVEHGEWDTIHYRASLMSVHRKRTGKRVDEFTKSILASCNILNVNLMQGQSKRRSDTT